MPETKTIGFFQIATIYYINKGVIREALEQAPQLMHQFGGLVFEVNLNCPKEFADLAEKLKNAYGGPNYFMRKAKFLEELKDQCLQCDQMKLFGIFEELLKSAEDIVIIDSGPTTEL